MHADAGYAGVEKHPEIVALERPIDWQIAAKRGVIKALAEGAQKDALKAVEKAKAAVRAFVEHPFHIVKNLCHHRKTRYRGLAKNAHQLHTLFVLANVMIGARRPHRAEKRSPARHELRRPGAVFSRAVDCERLQPGKPATSIYSALP